MHCVTPSPGVGEGALRSVSSSTSKQKIRAAIAWWHNFQNRVIAADGDYLDTHHPWCLGLRHRQSARSSPASASAWRRGGRQAYLRRPTSRRTGIAHGGAVMTVLDDTVGMLLYVVGEMAVTVNSTPSSSRRYCWGSPTRSARSSCPEPAGNSKCGQNCARKPPASWSRPRPGYSSSSRWITSLAPYRGVVNTLHCATTWEDDATRKICSFSTGAGCSGLNRGRQAGLLSKRVLDHIVVYQPSVA